MRRPSWTLDLERRHRSRLARAHQTYRRAVRELFEPGRWVGWLDGQRGRVGQVVGVRWRCRIEVSVVVRTADGGVAQVRAGAIRWLGRAAPDESVLESSVNWNWPESRAS